MTIGETDTLNSTSKQQYNDIQPFPSCQLSNCSASSWPRAPASLDLQKPVTATSS